VTHNIILNRSKKLYCCLYGHVLKHLTLFKKINNSK